MSDPAGRPRRRRQHRRSALRRTALPHSVQPRQGRVGVPQVLACGAVVLICAALIVLIWVNLGRAVASQRDATRTHAAAALTAQVATLALQVTHELQMVDQSLSVLQAAWDNDPDTFDLAKWRKLMPALTATSRDVFIANAHHIVVQDTMPAAVGEAVGVAYGRLANGALAPIEPNGSAAPGRSVPPGAMVWMGRWRL